jgi:hypothetical protein
MAVGPKQVFRWSEVLVNTGQQQALYNAFMEDMRAKYNAGKKEYTTDILLAGTLKGLGSGTLVRKNGALTITPKVKLSAKTTATLIKQGAKYIPPFSGQMDTALLKAIRSINNGDSMLQRLMRGKAFKVPESWADHTTSQGAAWHRLIEKESGGAIGVPNYTYFGWQDTVRLQWVKDPKQWPKLWAYLKEKVPSTNGATAERQFAKYFPGVGSAAIGVGQLLFPAAYMPEGNGGLGDETAELKGMLRYIMSRYTTPRKALEFHDRNGKLGNAWY